ncbi:MAG: TRAP transporter large permease subunit [Bilophila wadsworthia]
MLAGSIATAAIAPSGKWQTRLQRRVAVGTLACSGPSVIFIPPSTTFIIYGVLAQQSIGDLFVAGIIPGLLCALCFMAACGSWSSSSRASPRDCPNPPSTSGWPRSRRGCPSWASSSSSSAAFTAACSRRPRAAASGRSARCCSRSSCAA